MEDIGFGPFVGSSIDWVVLLVVTIILVMMIVKRRSGFELGYWSNPLIGATEGDTLRDYAEFDQGYWGNGMPNRRTTVPTTGPQFGPAGLYLQGNGDFSVRATESSQALVG